VGAEGATHCGLVERTAAPFERGQAHHDARRAESALAGTGADECRCPPASELVVEPFCGLDPASGDTAQRRDTGHPRRAVDQHRAAAALPLGAAAVFDRVTTEVLSERIEEVG